MNKRAEELLDQLRQFGLSECEIREMIDWALWLRRQEGIDLKTLKLARNLTGPSFSNLDDTKYFNGQHIKEKR